MSYIVCISKDAYKQNKTYYLRKGNTMKKSFVFAAVAATIAASSAMATEIAPTGVSNKFDWTGTASNLAEVCNFIESTDGSMTYAGGVWTASGASVEIKQRGAHMITVEPDHYVRETVTLGGSTLAGGVAHAVNVNYAPGNGGSDSEVNAFVQDATDPNNLGNTVEQALGGGNTVTYTAGSNAAGAGVISNLAGELDDTKKGKMEVKGAVETNGRGEVTGTFSLPGHLKININGEAELVDSQDEALIKNGASYAITHTVTCLK